MCAGRNTRRYTEKDIGSLALFLADCFDQRNFLQSVYDKSADAVIQRFFDLLRQLIVAVELDALCREARFDRRMQLAAGHDVDAKALFLADFVYCHSAERLRGVSSSCIRIFV